MHNKKRRIIVSVISTSVLLLVCVCTSLVSFSSDVFAQSDANTVLKKVMLQGLQTCYSKNNGYMVESASELDYTKTGISALITSAGNKDGKVKVPNSVGNTLSDADVSCSQLFLGYKGMGGSISGLFSLFGKSQSSTTLGNLGYNDRVSGSNGGDEIGCLSFTYSYREGTNATGDMKNDGKTNTICMPVGQDGIAQTGSMDDVTDDYTYNGPIWLNYVDGYIYINSSQYPTVQISSIPTGLSSKSWSSISQEFRTRADNLEEMTWADYAGNLIDPGYSNFKVTATTDGGDGLVEYKKSLIAATEALRYFTGDKEATFASWRLTDDDKYFLYSSYLNQALANHKGTLYTDGTCYSSKDSALAAAGSPGTERYVVRSGSQWCPLHGVSSVSESFNVIDGNGYQLKTGNFKDVVEALMAIDYDAVENSGTTVGTITGGEVAGIDNNGSNNGGTTGGDGTTGSNESGLAVCYEGTGVLGWIACPVIELVGNAASKLYTDYVEPLLQVRATEIMSTRGDGSVYQSWSTFRNFANILFAIGFAIIILAQLTGFGISNYNIKKLLPRLIVVAVLVNISFILCQIAVDLSNILGYSLRNLFLDMAGTIDGIEKGNVFGGIVGGITTGLFATTGVLAIAGVSVAAATLSSWIFPILLAFLSGAIAVIFFFILLGVRQAGIVILVVLTPLAIVCYALPNTKSLFDKWKKMFTALLLLYPLCGLLLGAGEYAGALLTKISQDSDAGMFYLLLAAMINVIPFFFIPSLLKQSMLAMGNLGARISGLGDRMRNGLQRNIRGSRAYQEHQAEEQRRLNYARDTTRTTRLGRRAEGKGIIGGARQRLAQGKITGKFVKPGLTNREMVRAAMAQSNIDRSTDATAQAIRARWESDGTANDIGDAATAQDSDKTLVARYLSASRRLFKNPTDRDALEEQKAAAMLLASTKPGRGELRLANNRLGEEIGSLSDATSQQNAKQVMQRTANNLLRSNSGDIAKSPLLDEQITGMQNINNDYAKMNANAIATSIQKLSARTMSDMSTADLRSYLQAMEGDDPLISPDSEIFNTLTTMASKTLSDPKYQGQIKADALPLLSQLANKKYAHQAPSGASQDAIASIRDQNAAALAQADSTELSRIHSDIKNGRMSANDSSTMLDAMGHALMRSMDASDSLNLSASQASEITKILNDGKYDLAGLARQHGISDPVQLQEKLDVATGMKVPRAPRQQTLHERHADWQRATEAQATASGGKFAQGDWINTTTGRRLNQRDAVEADMLEARDMETRKRDVQEKIDRDDAAYRRSQTPIPVPPSPSNPSETNPPTPPDSPTPPNP